MHSECQQQYCGCMSVFLCHRILGTWGPTQRSPHSVVIGLLPTREARGQPSGCGAPGAIAWPCLGRESAEQYAQQPHHWKEPTQARGGRPNQTIMGLHISGGGQHKEMWPPSSQAQSLFCAKKKIHKGHAATGHCTIPRAFPLVHKRVITDEIPLKPLFVYEMGVSHHKTISLELPFHSHINKHRHHISFRNIGKGDPMP